MKNEPKWIHPKILLIDLNDECEKVLREDGFNVLSGSFGSPYKVEKSDHYTPVTYNEVSMPNYTEREIFVIDLKPNKPTDKSNASKVTSDGEDDWWASCKDGIIDPRPRIMHETEDIFNRALQNGSVFIIFSDQLIKPKQILGRKPGYSLDEIENINRSNWGFLSIFNRESLSIETDYGSEISVLNKNLLLGEVLENHLKGASFNCTFRNNYINDKNWHSLAKNKYDQTVACGITDNDHNGLILLFPQIGEKHLFIRSLLKNVLPEICPKLYPEFKTKLWLREAPYEMHEIIEIKKEIENVNEEAKRKREELSEKIDSIRDEKSYIYDLVQETGTPLVNAVKKALETLGFKSVVDADKALEEAGGKDVKREDLQILDGTPALLVEVKGISGIPKDSDALQVWKYIAPRMKEWGKTEIQGISIINHQRNIPALDRENKKTFRDDILINATEQSFGLLTTWSLFRLLRSYLRNNWNHENIKELFYGNGVLSITPIHYEYIGKIINIWASAEAIGVKVEESSISLSDRISFETDVEFIEHEIESLQCAKKDVDKVVKGKLAGIKINDAISMFKKGMKVYKVVN